MSYQYVSSLCLVIATGFFMVACGSEDSASNQPEADTPSPERIAAENNPDLAALAAQESVKQMLALAKDGAWGAMIDAYYGEAHKFENDAQKLQLASRFKDGWGEKLIPVLEQAAEITPVLEEDKALFQVDGETIYELHLGDNGRWGFHL